jgi:Pentapeptide repeats (8 copies)
VASAATLPQYPASRVAPLATEVASANLDPKDALALKRDLLQYETDNLIKIWTTLAQAFGALVLAGGVYFTWSNLRIAQQSLRATEQKLDVDRQGQITSRFTEAVGQLGADVDGRPNLEVRLGGIYALKRIAEDSPDDHWTIREVLAAYVRQNAPWTDPAAPSAGTETPPAVIPTALHPLEASGPRGATAQPPRPRVDIQAALTVVGRLESPVVERPHLNLDLRWADLRAVELWHTKLREIDFYEAHLEGARFWSAELRMVKLERAYLKGAGFWGAHLEQVALVKADLQDSIFSGATLLENVDFAGADLRGTELKGADFQQAVNLTQKQVEQALGDADTRLPPGLTPPEAWGVPRPA